MILNSSGIFNFLCPSTLAINYNYQSLNEGIFNHRIEKNITLNGTIFANPTGFIQTLVYSPTGSPIYSTESGIIYYENGTEMFGDYYSLWSYASEAKPCDKDLYDIRVNNYSIGHGRIVNLTFQGGQDVTDKDYTAEIQFVETGSLFGMQSGAYYTGFLLDKNWAKQLLSFQGDSSFSKDNKNTYSYHKSLSIQTESGATYNARDVAENVAQAFFDQNVNLSSLTGIFPDIYFQQPNKRRQESINNITNTYSFSEDYTLTSGNPWNWSYEQSYNLNTNGISVVSEKGQIEGFKTPAYTYAVQGLNYALNSADVRAENFYFDHATGFSCLGDLILESKTINSDQGVGTINYSLSYTDDIEFSNTGAVYSHGSNLNIRGDGLAEISLNGEIQGLGSSSDDKILKALSLWDNISGDLQGQANEVYDNYTGELGVNTSRSPRLTSRSFSYSKHNGNVSYDWQFSDDPYLIDHTGFVRAEVSQEYNPVTPMVNIVSVPNYKEFFQPTIQGNLGSITNRVTLAGRQDMALSGYLSYATGILLGVPSGAIDPYVQSLSYTFSPLNRALSFDISWAYFKSGQINNNLNFSL